jgi:hypothetical protein
VIPGGRRAFVGALIVLETAVGAVSTVAAPLRVTTADPGGAALAGTLLIVRSLDGAGELFRALTDASGELPARDLEAGRYRVIAMYPHGPWKATVREFVVERAPVTLRLALSPLPAEGKKVAAAKKARLSVLTVDAKARAVPDVAILVRNPEATAEAWYQTNARGEVAIDLSTFDRAITLISFHGTIVSEREVTAAEIEALTRKRGRVILRVV